MPFPIIPATPAFDAAGTPYSPEYGDIYHSAESGPGQARGTCSLAAPACRSAGPARGFLPSLKRSLVSARILSMRY
jgi:tRNA U34 5-methylaminomethyl-2-thiouridine-forming methyltransferase MnmC